MRSDRIPHATSESKDVSPTPVPAATVLTGSKVSLADHLRLAELPLATTPGGKNFTFKALHPSTHEIKSARVPGGNRMSAALCCDMVYTIPITTANTTVDVTLTPNILVPASVTLDDGGSKNYFNFVNAAFGGSVLKNPTAADMATALANIERHIQTYRITSQSATMELIAPAMSDQGTITAAQYTMPPRVTGFVERSINNGAYSALDFQVFPKIELYEVPVTSSQLVLGTSAYTSKARDGVYMPLKLTDFHLQNINDPVIPMMTGLELGEKGSHAGHFSDPLTFPFFCDRTGTASANTTPAFPPNCGYNFGFITMTGMSKDTAVRLRVRQVVEITGYPSSTYAPIMEVALPPDDTAIRMYFEVSSRMADGYPASYNDLGKLKNIISGIAKKVAPFVSPALDILSKMPGVTGTLAGTAKQLLPVAQGFSKAADKAYASVMAAAKQVVGRSKDSNLARAASKAGAQKFAAKQTAKASDSKKKSAAQGPVVRKVKVPQRGSKTKERLPPPPSYPAPPPPTVSAAPAPVKRKPKGRKVGKAPTGKK